MRVTHVITRLIIGGAQENTIATVLGLGKIPGMEVRLLAGPASGPEGSLEPGLASTPGLLTLVPSLVRPIDPWHDVVCWARLVKVFRATRPEIVHTHSGKAGILGRFAARRAGVPVIIHTVHGPSFGPFQGPIANAALRAAERSAAGVTTHFISVADAMTRQYVAAGVGQPEQFTRILSGFMLEPFLATGTNTPLRARLGIEAGDFVIGKIARLFHLKGHEDLLAAAPEVLRRHPQSKFLLVGDGTLRERLEARARAAGLEKKVIFAGLVAPEEIPGYIGAMDMVVHLSRREGLPRSLAQALAAGRPIAAYDCDGANEVCLPGQTGFLVPPGDVKTLAGRLAQLAEDAPLRERFGRRGREFARENFDAGMMVEKIHSLYMKLTGTRAK
jgi:glycosyltransferase involved in cell wall biosynthesis